MRRIRDTSYLLKTWTSHIKNHAGLVLAHITYLLRSCLCGNYRVCCEKQDCDILLFSTSLLLLRPSLIRGDVNGGLYVPTGMIWLVGCTQYLATYVIFLALAVWELTAAFHHAKIFCLARHVHGEKSVVCKYWFWGRCKQGDGCEGLHRYDLARMPECQFWQKHQKCERLDNEHEVILHISLFATVLSTC